MGRVKTCYDNAVAESFFATLKKDRTSDRSWPARQSLKSALFEYIESWYNQKRRHSKLGYISPAQFELKNAG
jgi:transposase InsO family protein